MERNEKGRARRAGAPMAAAPARQEAARPVQPQRYAHPIERREERCEAAQAILCALAGQNQVLCAMKAELDEILAQLETQSAGETP